MPVKILLADKSITIQKVVEMLFSGRDYEVACVSDGDTALNEAARVVPDVVLVDVDLPRVDGYSLAARLKQTPELARTPVILMMSRDDTYDAAKGKQAGILDHIAKPFESQELIGKVKKALAAAPPRLAEPAPAAPAPPRPAAFPPPAKPAAGPKQAAPSDIFEIIQEAPTHEELSRMTASPAEEESVYEVEPEVEEVEESPAQESATALPIGAKAVEEMREGLGLTESAEEPRPEIVSFEDFDLAMETPPKTALPSAPKPAAPAPAAPQQPKPAGAPAQPPTVPEPELRKIVEETVARMAKQAFEKIPAPQTAVLPEGELRSMAEKTLSKMAADVFKDMPPPPIPKISDDTVRRGLEEAVSKIAREIARDVIERVAWEVIPPLAEQLIKAEIERLKAMET
ncbi:MAG: response regulator [Nitrospiraceae bacterium]|nr:response regulator [Nitrospiraceae bacterium]